MKKIASSFSLFLAALIWGLAFSAQKAASNVPPFALTAARSIIAAIVLLPIAHVFDRLSKNGRRILSRRGVPDFTKAELIGGTCCGVVLAAAAALQQMGISDTDAGKAAFITTLYVLIVPLLGLFLRQRSPLHVWISVVIAAIGFYFLCVSETFTVAPSDLLILLCALVFAIHILVIDRFAPKCDGIRMSCIQFFVAALVTFFISLIFEPRGAFAHISESILPILYLGIGSSGVGYTAQILGQKYTHPAVASVLLSLESVFGVLGAWIFFGEQLSPREYAGCLIVFIAVVLSQLDLSALKKHANAKTTK